MTRTCASLCLFCRRLCGYSLDLSESTLNIILAKTDPDDLFEDCESDWNAFYCNCFVSISLFLYRLDLCALATTLKEKTKSTRDPMSLGRAAASRAGSQIRAATDAVYHARLIELRNVPSTVTPADLRRLMHYSKAQGVSDGQFHCSKLIAIDL